MQIYNGTSGWIEDPYLRDVLAPITGDVSSYLLLPGRADGPRPPLAEVTKVDRAPSGCEDHRSGLQVLVGAPGKSAGSRGRSATVTYPVSRMNRANCSLVTLWVSMAKASTATR